ncbi:MAG TPA: hypothetical protein VNK24_09410 [Elusimicrobiota bacterium]|nr:hypothetical protein [Elusimicrobiota bacterium]
MKIQQTASLKSPRIQANSKRAAYVGIGEAAKMLGVSRWALFNAAKESRLRLVKNRRGFYYVRKDDLEDAPILTLGKAARLSGRHYETLRRAAKRGELKTIRRIVKGWNGKPCSGYRHVSLREAARFSAARRRFAGRRDRLS